MQHSTTAFNIKKKGEKKNCVEKHRNIEINCMSFICGFLLLVLATNCAAYTFSDTEKVVLRALFKTFTINDYYVNYWMSNPCDSYGVREPCEMGMSLCAYKFMVCNSNGLTTM